MVNLVEQVNVKQWCLYQQWMTWDSRASAWGWGCL